MSIQNALANLKNNIRAMKTSAGRAALQIEDKIRTMTPTLVIGLTGKPAAGDAIWFAVGDNGISYVVESETTAGDVARALADCIRSDKNLGAVLSRRRVMIPGVSHQSHTYGVIEYSAKEVEVITYFINTIVDDRNPESVKLTLECAETGIAGCHPVALSVNNAPGSTLKLTPSDQAFSIPGCVVPIANCGYAAKGIGDFRLWFGIPTLVEPGLVPELRAAGYIE